MTSAEVGKRIRDLREKRGIYGKDLAKMVGMGANRLSDLENGKRGIHLDEIPVFAQALGVSNYYLLTEIADENHSVADDLGLSDRTISRIRGLSTKQKALLEILINDDGSVTDPDREPEYGFLDALSNYCNDPNGNRIVEVVVNPEDPLAEHEVRQAPHSLRIRLADGSIHEVSEWKPDSRNVLSRLKTVRIKYLSSRKEMQYVPTEEEEDEE